MRPAHLSKEDIQSGPPAEWYKHLEVADFNRHLERLHILGCNLSFKERYEVAGWVAEQMPAYKFIDYKTALLWVAKALRIPQK